MKVCDQYRAQWIELARSGAPAPLGHLDTCPECYSFFQAQRALEAALSEIRTDAAPDLEPRLLAEFDAASRRGAHPFRWWPAVAAAVIAVVLFTAAPKPSPTSTFYQIPYTAPLAPYERARIVRMDVPISALIAAGFDIHYTDTAAVVPAEVLFGQDGRAHAIRLIPNSDRRSD